MQMIRDSLMPEAMAKFLREEALRPHEQMTVERAHLMGEQEKTADPAVERAERMTTDIAAKRDRDAEEADRAAFAKRKARETVR